MWHCGGFQADPCPILGTSPGLPAHLILCYQTTSFGVMSKVMSMKLILPILVMWTYLANTDDLKQRIRECIQGISKEILQHVVTHFPLWLQDCIEHHGGHQQSVIFKFSWTWNVPASVNKIFPLCLKIFCFRTIRCFWCTPEYECVRYLVLPLVTEWYCTLRCGTL